MSIQYIQITNQSNKVKGSLQFQTTETMLPNGYGDTHIFPEQIGKIDKLAVSLICDITPKGKGHIEFTISSINSILSGTCIWQLWDNGIITNNKSTLISYPVNAIRQYNYYGMTIMEIHAQ